MPPLPDIAVYNHPARLKKKLAELDSIGHLNERDRQAVRDYVSLLFASNISPGRILKHLHFALLLSRECGLHLSRIDRQNVQGVVAAVNQ